MYFDLGFMTSVRLLGYMCLFVVIEMSPLQRQNQCVHLVIKLINFHVLLKCMDTPTEEKGKTNSRLLGSCCLS